MAFGHFPLRVYSAGHNLVAPRPQALLILCLIMAAGDSTVAWILGDLFYKMCFWDHRFFLFTIRISWGNVVQNLCQFWQFKQPASKYHTWLLEPSMTVSVLTWPKLSSSFHLKTHPSYKPSLPDLLSRWIWVNYEVIWKFYASRVKILEGFFCLTFCYCDG